MGGHDAPVSWVERWRQQEPLRLWLWSIAVAVVALAGVAGWLTAQLAVAVTGVAAAVLMIGGTAAARRDAFAPATVRSLLDDQHADSYARGYQAALRVAEQAAAQSPELEPATEALRALEPATQPQRTLARCRYVESARRCTLPRHPDSIDHRLEVPKVRE